MEYLGGTLKIKLKNLPIEAQKLCRQAALRFTKNT